MLHYDAKGALFDDGLPNTHPVDHSARSHVENPGHSRESYAEIQAATGNRIGSWLQTYTGRAVYPLDLRPADVDIRDIAHSLAMQCRYAGHCLRPYSVAEHSVHVARWLRPRHGPDVALEGLMHDASETYLVDIPRPVKPFLLGYGDAERCVTAVVAERFGLSAFGLPAAVHEADNRILADERAQNMAPCEREWEGMSEPLGVTLEFWSPERAEREFLALFEELYGEDR